MKSEYSQQEPKTSAPLKSTTVRVGSVSLPFYEHAKGFRFAFKDAHGKWCYVTRRDKAEAMDLAKAKARELSNGVVDIGAIDPDQAALVRRMLALGITHADLDAWQEDRQRTAIDVPDAYAEFMASKKANRGPSYRNIRSLSGDVGGFVKYIGKVSWRSVTVSQLEAWLKSYGGISKSRRKNLRGSVVTFFRWGRKRNHLPRDITTAAELLDVPRVVRKVPETWTPDQMSTMLQHCPEEYLPWLVLAGFEHMRLEELFKDPKSDKSPLDWSDFKWDREIIIVRAETAKVGERRIVPILPVTRAWLFSHRKESGPVCPKREPYKVGKKTPSITQLLGAHVGGWKPNALRHSSISYRAAVVGLAQTSMEAGNSESEARKSYNDAKSKQEAEQWFALFPGSEKNFSEPSHNSLSFLTSNGGTDEARIRE